MALRSIFDDWDDNRPVQDELTGDDLVTVPTETIANHDGAYANTLYQASLVLQHRLELSEEVVDTAHEVSKFVPNLENEEYKKFWMDSLVPGLVDSVDQYTKANSFMTHAFGSIRNLAIIMQKASEIVQQSHGSDKGIEIAKKDVPDALSKLENYIKQVGEMENTAIDSFPDKLKTIFEIVGPEAVKFVENKADLQTQLDELINKQKNVVIDLNEKQGELSRYAYLVSATERQLNGAEAEAESTKVRIDELRKLNSEIEQTIQGLPASQTDSKSPEEQRKYYESMIMARNEHLKEELGEKEAEQKIAKELSENLSEYKGKYETLRNEVEQMTKVVNEKITEIQRQIDELYKKIQDADAEQINIEGMIGLQGKALIDCLTSIKLFGSKIREGVSVYAPVSNILKIIQSIVKSDVDLLDGSTTDVFLAARRLMQSFQMFMSFAKRTDELLTHYEEKKAIGN